MRYVFGLSVMLGVLTWRTDDVSRVADLAVHALSQLLR
jgi:hypothetical protein